MSLPTPTLHAERLLLRPFTDADAEDLFALQSNAEALRYWDSPPWTDRSRIARFMNGCRQMADEGSGARVAITCKSDGAFVAGAPSTGGIPTSAAPPSGTASTRRLGAAVTRRRQRASCCTGPSTVLISTGFSRRLIRATWLRLAYLRSSASYARGHCARTASSMATCLTPGCTAC